MSIDLREMAARHFATTSAGSTPSSARRDSAAVLKYCAVASGTLLDAKADVLATACSAASVDGGPLSSNLKP
jgi:hypothetical protein